MISERRQIAERFLSEGNCEAARIRGNRVRDLNKIQAFCEFTRTMQSYRFIIAANTTLILSTDSDLFSFLKEMDSTGDAAGDQNPGEVPQIFEVTHLCNMRPRISSCLSWLPSFPLASKLVFSLLPYYFSVLCPFLSLLNKGPDLLSYPELIFGVTSARYLFEQLE
jgi:hypothetical protein